MVEFALSLTLFICIFVVIFDLGRAVYAYNVLSSMVREGARYAVLDPTHPPEIADAARAVAFGLPIADITITSACSPNCNPASDITVAATYRFLPISPLLPALDLRSASTMTIE